jgi:hypothetical protein
MDSLQRHNVSEIEALNQRGGRTLSFVDLVRAGTLSAELVAYCWTAIAHGASFLTAARPGGAGKSTVLANLLVLLPPGEGIATVGEPEAGAPGRCTLAHEIGSGPYYGYIWGSEAREFLGLAESGQRIASCLHADTLEELRDVLLSPPIQVSEVSLSAADLVLFIHVLGGQRRVVAAHEGIGNGHRLAFRWDEAADRIVSTGPSELLPRLGAAEREYARRLAAGKAILGRGDERVEVVREQVLAAYGAS